MSKPLDFSNPRLRWAIGAAILGLVDLIIFISCLLDENTRCTAISGITGIIIMCIAAWHGLIYAAQHKGGL